MADVPLLDELAELLGVDDSAAKAARRALERAQRLETSMPRRCSSGPGWPTSAWSTPRRWPPGTATTAPRSPPPSGPGADRSWAYGHVIIDEAQELSSMAWRMVLRRNPTRSMTVVGDVAQTGSRPAPDRGRRC